MFNIVFKQALQKSSKESDLVRKKIDKFFSLGLK